MLPKLRITIREAILRARSNPRATASGYHHTHFDTRGLDIPILATFPDDDEINAAAEEAADEAESLLALLGLTPKQLQRNPVTVLPSIDSFLVGEGDGQGEEDNQGSGDEDTDGEDDIVVSEAQELHDLVHRAERNDEPGLSQFAEAAALVTAGEFMRMYVPWVPFNADAKLTRSLAKNSLNSTLKQRPRPWLKSLCGYLPFSINGSPYLHSFLQTNPPAICPYYQQP